MHTIEDVVDRDTFWVAQCHEFFAHLDPIRIPQLELDHSLGEVLRLEVHRKRLLQVFDMVDLEQRQVVLVWRREPHHCDGDPGQARDGEPDLNFEGIDRDVSVGHDVELVTLGKFIAEELVVDEPARAGNLLRLRGALRLEPLVLALDDHDLDHTFVESAREKKASSVSDDGKAGADPLSYTV